LAVKDPISHVRAAEAVGDSTKPLSMTSWSILHLLSDASYTVCL
jgi:hypothetical protein